MGSDLNFSLEPIRRALKKLGDPQDAYPTVLIGGTNGKGSTSAMLEGIVRCCGLRTGLFHSPAPSAHKHVHLDGQAVDRPLFAEHFLRADRAGDLSWFETVTAAAFGIFHQAGVDLAVVEVGLGGAQDCTNVIRAPEVSMVVSVGLDHTRMLGSDLRSITEQKARIFRSQRTALIGQLPQEAAEACERVATQLGSELKRAEDLASWVSEPDGRSRIETTRHCLSFRPPLAGEHQLHNGALAVLAAEELEERSILPKRDASIWIDGLEQCRWPGRLQWLPQARFSDGRLRRSVLIDSAHNPPAIHSLANYWHGTEGHSADILFGAFGDKDIKTIMGILRPIVHRIHLTTTGHRRSASPQDLLDHWCAVDGDSSRVASTGALAECLETCLNEDTRRPLIIAGSLDLIHRTLETTDTSNT